jgi:deoxyribodipyrimidine photolyase-related protein
VKTVCILGDQLSPEYAALRRTQPGESRVLMIESKARGSALPYHQLKLVLVYSAMRHFAAELRESGWLVDYRLIKETPAFEAGLRHHLETRRPDALVLAKPNSFSETDAITRLGRKLRAPIELVPTRQFLLQRDEFPRLGRRAEAAAHGKSLPANAEGA